MSANTELSRIFDEMAKVLELTGANPFRVNAHAKVARILRNMSVDVSTLAGEKSRLLEIDGIGEGSAAKIIEYCTTGRVEEHRELTSKVPLGLFDIMQIPGLGPKSIKLMWEQAGVTDIATLRKAMDEGVIENLPRMGKKSVENIREALAFAAKAAERTRLGEAMPVAEDIVAQLRKVKGAKRVEYAGSLRRGRETIGDIDILAATKSPSLLSEVFRSQPGVTKVLASGETKSSIRLHDRIQVDLRIVPEDSFGAALMYFTGSKEHNVALRERALKEKMRLNEYGLFPLDDEDEPPQKRGVKPVASRTEEVVYAALDLPWIPPEIREDQGELSRDLPDLIEFGDIKCELHAHTTASDGLLSIDQLAAEAKRRGFHTIAVTDHSKSSVQANGLDEKRLREHIKAIRAANAKVKGITILAGSEVDITSDGRLDYPDDLLAELDIVVASPHIALKQDPEKATKRLLAAIRNPFVHILGHPTGRVIGRREGLHPDMSAIIKAAVEHDVALEINANYLRLDLRDAHVRSAVEAGAKIAIDTDAHTVADFDQLRYGVMTARRGWLEARQCINTWPKQKLHKWLKSKRE